MPRPRVDPDDPYGQYKGVDLSIVRFPLKQRASIIAYNPDHPPAAFPSSDWLEQNGLPLLVSTNDRPDPTGFHESERILQVNSPQVEKCVQPLSDHANDFGRNVDWHNSNDIDRIWNIGSAPRDADRDCLASGAVGAMEISETDGTGDGAFYSMPGMDTSEEEAEEEQNQWSDIPPSLQVRICVNLAVTNQVNAETAIQVLMLSSAEAELTLRHCVEREIQTEQEHTLSAIMIQDQLNALLRQNGTSSIREEREEQLQLFEGHFRSRQQFLKQDYLNYSLRDLARAEKYLSIRRLDVQLARRDLEANTGPHHLPPNTFQATTRPTWRRGESRHAQQAPNVDVGCPSAVKKVLTNQPVRNNEDVTQKITTGSACLHPRKQQTLGTCSAPNTPPSTVSINSGSPPAKGPSAEYDELAGRRSGLRTGRERRMTEKAREAIENGMAVPGGNGQLKLRDQTDQDDEDYVPEGEAGDFNEYADAVAAPKEPSLLGLKIKLKLNDKGEAVLRRQDPSKQPAENVTGMTRNEHNSKKVGWNDDANGQQAPRLPLVGMTANPGAKGDGTHHPHHENSSPVARQVVSHQGSPPLPCFSRMAQEELDRVAADLTDKSNHQLIPSERMTYNDRDEINSIGRQTSIADSPPSTPADPQQLGEFLNATLMCPESSAETQAMREEPVDGHLPRPGNQIPRIQSSLPHSVLMTQPQQGVLSVFESSIQIRQQRTNNQIERADVFIPANQKSHKHHEQFSFPFVRIPEAQEQLEPSIVGDEEGNVRANPRQASDTLTAVRDPTTLSRSTGSEEVESQSEFDPRMRRITQRSCSEPPQTPARAELLHSHVVRKGIAQVYSELTKSTASSKNLSHHPDTSERAHSTSDSSAELPDTPTPMPRAQSSIRTISGYPDNLVSSVEAAETPKRSGNSTPLIKPHTPGADRHSSSTDGWQPESIAMAKKAGLLVGDDAGHSSMPTRVSPAKSSDGSSAPAAASVSKRTMTTGRKRRLQLSSENGELIDPSNGKTEGQAAQHNRQPNIPRNNVRVPHGADSAPIRNTPQEDQPMLSTGDIERSRDMTPGNLDDTAPEVSFDDASLQDVPTSTKSGIPLVTLKGNRDSPKNSASVRSSPDPIQNSSPLSPLIAPKRKANTQKRPHSMVSPAKASVSPPRKVQAAAESGSSHLQAQTGVLLQNETPVLWSNTQSNPDLKSKLDDNSQERNRSSVSSSSSMFETVLPVRAPVTATMDPSVGKTKPASKKTRSSTTTTIGSSAEETPNNEQAATAAEDAASLHLDNNTTASITVQSKTDIEAASTSGRKKTKSKLMANTKAAPVHVESLSSLVAARTRGTKETPATVMKVTERKTANEAEAEAEAGKSAKAKIASGASTVQDKKTTMTRGKAKTRGSTGTASSTDALVSTMRPPQDPSQSLQKKASTAVRRSGRKSERVEID